MRRRPRRGIEAVLPEAIAELSRRNSMIKQV